MREFSSTQNSNMKLKLREENNIENVLSFPSKFSYFQTKWFSMASNAFVTFYCNKKDINIVFKYSFINNRTV